MQRTKTTSIQYGRLSAPAVQQMVVTRPVVQRTVMAQPVVQQTVVAPSVVQHTVVTPPAQDVSICPGYMSKASVGLGVTQIIIGVLCVVFAIVFMVLFPDGTRPQVSNSHTAAGIWLGVLFIVTGILGVLASKKNKCMIISFMILVIFAGAGAGLILLTISAIDMNYGREVYDSYYDSYDYFYTTLVPPSREVHSEVRALATCMLALSVLEGIIACISFGITCHGLCCRSTQGTIVSTGPAVAVVQTQPSVTVTRTFTTTPCPQYGYDQGMIHQAPTGYGQPPPAYFAGPPQPPAYTNVV